MSKLRGLPAELRMRHDFHFVEELSVPNKAEPVGKMISLDLLDVNPHQPRKSPGNIEDLVSSIKEKGLLEPILVREDQGRYQIIAGERRYHASRAAGLRQAPCIELEVDDGGVLEISLIENLQRKDLTPFEEGDAVKSLCDRFGYTHENIARKLGKSRTSVTELLSIATIPEEIRERCRQADISSKSLLVEVARQYSIEEMERFVARISKGGISRSVARRMKDSPQSTDPADTSEIDGYSAPSAPRPFTFKFRSDDQQFSVKLRFENSEVRKADVISALHGLIRKIQNSGSLPS